MSLEEKAGTMFISIIAMSGMGRYTKQKATEEKQKAFHCLGING